MSRGPLEADRERPFLVAAPGRSHGGDLKRARRIIEAAAAADVDAVQLPLYRTDHLVSSVYDAEGAAEYRRTELDREAYASLAEKARRVGTRLAPTVYDPTLLEWVLQRDPPYIRFHGGDLTYRRLLSRASTASVPVLIGTEAAAPNEISRALDWLGQAAERTVLLDWEGETSGTSHPAGGRMLETGTPYGHPGKLREARVIEGRLGANEPSGSDLARTITRPLQQLGRLIRGDSGGGNPSQSAGSGPGSTTGRPEDPGSVRRSLMADRPLSAGTILEPDMIRELRPAGGVPAGRFRECLGLRLARPADPMEMIACG